MQKKTMKDHIVKVKPRIVILNPFKKCDITYSYDLELQPIEKMRKIAEMAEKLRTAIL